MDELFLWIGASTAVALFCLAQGGFWLLRGRQHRREEQLKQRIRGGQGGQALQGGKIQIRSKLGQQAAGNVAVSLRLTLQQAGSNLTLAGALGRAFALAGFMLLVFTLLFQDVLIGLGGGLLGLFVAHLIFASRRDKNVRLFEEQLATALEAMVFALRAGRSLEESLHSAAEEVEAPLAPELSRVYQETALGRPVEVALEQLRDRWPQLRALRAFVEAVGVLKRTGGNLVEVMQTMTAGLHAQALFEVRHRALTSEGRMSGRILMGLPIFALVVQALLAPEQLAQLVGTPTGQTVLMASAGLWALGAFWISRLTRPDR
ncbi:MAG: type II secretion system F family protein [Deltaproteobacteria bacterium]|nr:type II secretion system F family protein [Deltaproteobacteria bacterium]